MIQSTYDISLKIDAPVDEVMNKIMTPNISKKALLASPFVKWVGGKGAIAEQIKKHIPDTIENYYELFAGGGAVFFSLRDKDVKHFTLNDNNRDLMIAYEVIQKNVQDLIVKLSEHAGRHNKEYYYSIRAQKNLSDPVMQAARFIYLNRTCYNGLYRVNKRGEFNAPMGSYTNPAICNVENLNAVHEKLKGVDVILHSFTDIDVKDGAVVYCDPPYDECYNQYSEDKFSGNMQEELMKKALDWQGRGCKVIISNSDTDFIRSLYRDKIFTIHEIDAPRIISCKASGRGKKTELLIVTG